MSIVTLLPRITLLNSYEQMKMINFGIWSSLFKWSIQPLPLPLLCGFFYRNGTMEGGKNHRLYILPAQGTATGEEWMSPLTSNNSPPKAFPKKLSHFCSGTTLLPYLLFCFEIKGTQKLLGNKSHALFALFAQSLCKISYTN